MTSKKDKSSRFDALFGAARSQKPEQSSAHKAQHPDIQTSESLDIQMSKSKNPDYQRTTLYLPKRLHRKFKLAAMKSDREMSDIMEELIHQWLESRSDV